MRGVFAADGFPTHVCVGCVLARQRDLCHGGESYKCGNQVTAEVVTRVDDVARWTRRHKYVQQTQSVD